MKTLVVLTGAGVSAESGIKTFRDHDGLWEGHDVMEVASPQGWERDRELVLDFYNKRRAQLHEVEPNDAHQAIADLQKEYDVQVITQNVDDLHERAGSNNVLHLHGELFKVRSTKNPDDVKEWKKDLKTGDVCEMGGQLRPHVVWFGEGVPAMEDAVEIIKTADILLIVGTSLQVYPAAGLMDYAPEGTPVYLIDPSPALSGNDRLTVIKENAGKGMKRFKELLEN